MVFLSVLPPGFEIVGLKVAAIKPKLYTKLDAHDVPVGLKLLNQQAAAHVLKIRFQIYISSPDKLDEPAKEWTFYRELAYDNQGSGWKLTPYQSLQLNLRAFLNDEGHRLQMKQVLERRVQEQAASAEHYGHLRVRILADVAKLAVAPHAWVDIYLDR